MTKREKPYERENEVEKSTMPTFPGFSVHGGREVARPSDVVKKQRPNNRNREREFQPMQSSPLAFAGGALAVSAAARAGVPGGGGVSGMGPPGHGMSRPGTSNQIETGHEHFDRGVRIASKSGLFSSDSEPSLGSQLPVCDPHDLRPSGGLRLYGSSTMGHSASSPALRQNRRHHAGDSPIMHPERSTDPGGGLPAQGFTVADHGAQGPFTPPRMVIAEHDLQEAFNMEPEEEEPKEEDMVLSHQLDDLMDELLLRENRAIDMPF
jgi:hypothetical protein